MPLLLRVGSIGGVPRGGASLDEESVNALREVSEKYTTDTAKAFVAGYSGGLPVSTYQTAFDFLHTQGMQSVPLETAVEQADPGLKSAYQCVSFSGCAHQGEAGA